MKKFLIHLSILSILAAVALPMIACAPQEEEGAMEEAGEAMEEGAEEMGEEMEEAGDAMEEGMEEGMEETGEAMEETGLDLDNLKQFRAYSKPNRDPRQHNISIVFTAEAKGTPLAGDDAKRVRLFSADNLPAPLCFDHAQIIADYLAAKK